ncbi:MAG: HAMP domain-containing histidine kinase [Oscillospiraceae bacterium]|jgi:signal transduction histidine kinase|nr:HAMP domain-containing histidine kinase [Oscillospiraceae bacterium]
MKKMSITLRITLWYALLMLLIVLSVLGFMMVISDSIIQSNAEGRLNTIVEYNIDEVEYDDGELEIDNAFESFKNGVSSLVYTADFLRVEGRLPDSFPEETEFVDSQTRLINADSDRYLVYDRLLTFKKHPSVWVRGVLPLDTVSGVTDSLFQTALFTLPILVVLAAVGGYWITKRAFRQVRVMNQTVESITEGRDLSRRVPIEDGRDEIRALAVNFNGMLERLESSFEAEKQFVSDVSHELRTPVSVILAQCEYSLGQEPPDKETRDSFLVVQRQAERMHRLIVHLLTITRLEQGQFRIVLQNTDVSALVLSLVEEAADLTPGYITVRHEIQPGIYAPVDAPLFSRVFQNLSQNAIKYGKSHVIVSLWAEGGKGFLKVTDDGIGIAPEDQEKIWQRFYQVDPARTSDEAHSMGLGLSIAKQIALLHHGGITLESKTGEGSAFTFMFPSF